jgi:hypothetical protein
VETDLRDHDGRVVVSHDPPLSPDVLDFTELLALWEVKGSGLPLALNIKADGLADLLAIALQRRKVDCFVFDMSVPDSVQYMRRALPMFTRQSDLEPDPTLYASAKGVWLDAFETDWMTESVVSAHLSCGKLVCIVSPELHGRAPEPLWSEIRLWSIQDRKVLLCTDRLREAEGYFA